MTTYEILATISRHFHCEVVDNSSIIKVHKVDIISELVQTFMGRCNVAEGFDYKTGKPCTFVSPEIMNLTDAVFMASKLEKVYIKERPIDDRCPKRLVVNGQYLYNSSGYKYTANSPFIPSIEDFTSEWRITG